MGSLKIVVEIALDYDFTDFSYVDTGYLILVEYLMYAEFQQVSSIQYQRSNFQYFQSICRFPQNFSENQKILLRSRCGFNHTPIVIVYNSIQIVIREISTSHSVF